MEHATHPRADQHFTAIALVPVLPPTMHHHNHRTQPGAQRTTNHFHNARRPPQGAATTTTTTGSRPINCTVHFEAFCSGCCERCMLRGDALRGLLLLRGWGGQKPFASACSALFSGVSQRQSPFGISTASVRGPGDNADMEQPPSLHEIRRLRRVTLT